MIEQEILEAIEQILLESEEFKWYHIDQVKLGNTPILLPPGRQKKSDEKVNTIHAVAPEDRKVQARQSLKIIYSNLLL